jgi:hypothetical protein
MVLTKKDIELIKKHGYDDAFFVCEHDGWFLLKNSEGRCVFHNGTQCCIYEFRPEGCSLYPVVFDKDTNTMILDSECPQKNLFPRSKQKETQLRHLVSVLEGERALRKKIKNK